MRTAICRMKNLPVKVLIAKGYTRFYEDARVNVCTKVYTEVYALANTCICFTRFYIVNNFSWKWKALRDNPHVRDITFYPKYVEIEESVGHTNCIGIHIENIIAAAEMHIV